MKQQSWSSFGRLTHPAQLILLSLQDHPMAGRELLTFLEQVHQVPLEPGTLWATLGRLERVGWISSEPLSYVQAKEYRLTDSGFSMLARARRVLEGQRERIREQIPAGLPALLLMIISKWIVRLYPKAWRERYEEEMIELLSTHEITFWTWLDLLWNALITRLDPFYRRSALLSPFRREKRVQRALLVAVLLPLFSAVWYWIFFFMGGLHNDYWTRNEHYPILALTHELGSLGITVVFFSAWLSCIVLAYQGIKRFGRPADALLHRLILVAMCLPAATMLLVAFFSPFSSEEVGRPIFVGSVLLISLLLTYWGVLRREVFRRAFLYLLPWLGINFCFLMLIVLQVLTALSTTSPDAPLPEIFQFLLLIPLASLLSVPVSFAVAMIRLRLGKQLRSILLIVATAGTLGMTLVQLMMLMRLLILHLLHLSTIWTTELIAQLILNVLFTALALVVLLTLLLGRGRKASPTSTSSFQVLRRSADHPYPPAYFSGPGAQAKTGSVTPLEGS
jgi:DNA-binding PadR family transcriptional regulator